MSNGTRKLQVAGKFKDDSAVKSVNGVAPDSNGDVKVEIPEGSGLPEGGSPHQQLVTDAEGNAKWEDRVGYVKSSTVNDIVPEETLTFENDSGILGCPLTEKLSLDPTITYSVKWNGVRHDVVCKTFNDIPYIGDISPLTGDPSLLSGEPFLIITLEQTIVFMLDSTSDEDITRTFALFIKDEDISPIPEKFMPKDYMPRSDVLKADWNEMDEKSLAYIENRPCYVIGKSIQDSVECTGILIGSNFLDLELDGIEIIENEQYVIDYDFSLFVSFKSNPDVSETASVIGRLMTKGQTDGNLDLSDIPELKVHISSHYPTVQINCFYGSRSYYAGRLGVSGTNDILSSVYDLRLVANKFSIRRLKELDEVLIPASVKFPTPTTATVGQTLVVKAVDENGKPTEWECVDQAEELPTITTADAGKFLRVSADGKWAAESIANAEEASF